MNRILAVVALAGVAAAANAQDFFRIDLQVNDGSGWSDAVSVLPGTPVQARIIISAQRAAGLVSLGGTQITRIDINGVSGLGDAASGFAGLISPGTQVFGLSGLGGANAALDRVPTSGSIQLAQNPVNSGGVATNPLEFFSFTYTPDATQGTRILELEGTSTAGRITLANVFTTAGGTSATMTSVASFDGARIDVIPAPGALALAGAGLLAAGRRRR